MSGVQASPVATIKELHDAARALDAAHDTTAAATLKCLVDANEAISAAFAAFDTEKAAHERYIESLLRQAQHLVIVIESLRKTKARERGANDKVGGIR